MYANLKALFLDADQDACESLAEALAPQFYFIEKNFVSSFHRGLEILLSETVDVCFTSSALGAAAAKIFLIDARKIERNQKCVFILVENQLPNNSDRAAAALAAGGYATVITRACLDADFDALKQVIKPTALSSFEEEVRRKLVDVNEAIQLVLQELDNVAMDRKRGLPARFNKIAPDFVAELTQFHDQVLENYYAALVGRLAEETARPPEGFCKLSVPQEVLDKKLPDLHREGYSGRSRRTWKKLAKRFGIDAGGTKAKRSHDRGKPGTAE